MNLLTVLLSFSFVIIALFLSSAFKLGLGRDLIITSIRATIQLFVIGYILTLFPKEVSHFKRVKGDSPTISGR